MTHLEKTKEYLESLKLQYREESRSIDILLVEGDKEVKDVNGIVCKAKPMQENTQTQLYVESDIRTIALVYYFNGDGNFVCINSH